MDYSKGKIYRIINSDLEQYYGSTTRELRVRINEHRCDFNAWYKDNTKQYLSSFEVLKGKNVEIELIYDCPCSSREELHKCEQVFIDNDDCVNKCPAFSTNTHYEDNKQKILERSKKHYEDNKQKILERSKKYNEANKDKIREYHKKYHKAKKEKTI